MKRLQRNTLSACLAAVGLGLGAGLAHADDAGIKYKINGYGTVGTVVTDRSDLAFHTSSTTSEGAGSRPDLGVDSRIGLQGVVDFGNGFSATAQLLAKRRATDTFGADKDLDVGVEWLFAQYALTPNLDVKLGRVVLPVFLISDSLAVGYSQPWLRAPLEVYSMSPLTTLDGIQAVWRIALGSSVVTVQPTYGTAKAKLPTYSPLFGGNVIDLNLDHLAGLNVSVEHGPWLARVGQTRAQLPFDVQVGLNTFLGVTMKDTFTSAGVQYDDGSIIVMTEFAKRAQNDQPLLGGKPIVEEKAWYVAGGYRFGKWLPMLAYGHTSVTQLGTDKPKQHSVMLNLRYDLMNNVALKGQIARYKDTNPRPFVAPGTSNDGVNVYSVAVDFVF